MRMLILALVGASCALAAAAQDLGGEATGMSSVDACLALQDGGEAGLSIEDIRARVARCSSAGAARSKTGEVIMQRPGDGASNLRVCIAYVMNQNKRPRPAPPSPAKYSEAEARSICSAQ